MAGLITYDSARRLQDMSDQLRGLSAGGSGAGVGGTTLRQRTSTFANTRTGYAYGAIPGLSGGEAGKGSMKFDRLNVDRLTFGTEDSDNPHTVYNLTPVIIPDGSRLIAWRDGTALDVNEERASAWYVGGTSASSTPPGNSTAILIDAATGSLLPDVETRATFTLGLTNDATTLVPVNAAGQIPGPNVSGPYAAIKILRPGDYMFRWGYAVEFHGDTQMGGDGDYIEVTQNGDIPPKDVVLIGDYLIAKFQPEGWQSWVRVLGENSQFLNDDGHQFGKIFRFIQQDFNSGNVHNQDAWSYNANRFVQLMIQRDGLSSGSTDFSLTSGYLEIERMGDQTQGQAAY